MEIKCLGSSSDGNCFLVRLDNHSKPFMIECGFTIEDIERRALLNGASLNDIDDVFITHGHKDHCLCAKTLAKRGKRILASASTLESIHLPQRAKSVKLEDCKTFTFTAEQTVIPFTVEHDFPETLGFMFFSEEESLLFINDFKRTEYLIDKVSFDVIMVECNYDHQKAHIAYNGYMKSGDIAVAKTMERTFRTHQSLAGCKKFLNSLDLVRTHAIFLMHMSDRNSNPVRFVNEIYELTKIRPRLCLKNGGIS